MRSPPKTAKPRRVLDRPRPDSQWSPQEPGRRKHSGRACARIGVGYGALGQATWRAFPHWGRQEGIGVGKLPTPMGGFLPQFLPPLPCRQRTPYPNRWFPAPMRLVGKRRRRGARSGGYTAWPPGARVREPRAMGCFHSDTDTTDPNFRSDTSAFTALPRFANVITLLVFRRKCNVRCVWASSGFSSGGVCVVVG